MGTSETVFSGATAIVTGGASGIGRALSERLGKLGASVTVADLQSDLAENVADGIKRLGRKGASREVGHHKLRGDRSALPERRATDRPAGFRVQ